MADWLFVLIMIVAGTIGGILIILKLIDAARMRKSALRDVGHTMKKGIGLFKKNESENHVPPQHPFPLMPPTQQQQPQWQPPLPPQQQQPQWQPPLPPQQQQPQWQPPPQPVAPPQPQFQPQYNYPPPNYPQQQWPQQPPQQPPRGQ